MHGPKDGVPFAVRPERAPGEAKKPALRKFQVDGWHDFSDAREFIEACTPEAAAEWAYDNEPFHDPRLVRDVGTGEVFEVSVDFSPTFYARRKRSGQADEPACWKCGAESGDSWSQCGGECPIPHSPHFSERLRRPEEPK